MKKLILLISFLLIPSICFAGMGACHDGAGNITILELDANKSFFQKRNCVYYEVWKDGITKKDYERIRKTIKENPKKHIKWLNEPIVMTENEISSVELAESEKIAESNALRAERLDYSIEDVIIALVKVINTRIPQNPITKEEVVEQLKKDMGLQ